MKPTPLLASPAACPARLRVRVTIGLDPLATFLPENWRACSVVRVCTRYDKVVAPTLCPRDDERRIGVCRRVFPANNPFDWSWWYGAPSLSLCFEGLRGTGFSEFIRHALEERPDQAQVLKLPAKCQIGRLQWRVREYSVDLLCCAYTSESGTDG